MSLAPRGAAAAARTPAVQVGVLLTCNISAVSPSPATARQPPSSAAAGLWDLLAARSSAPAPPNLRSMDYLDDGSLETKITSEQIYDFLKV